MGHPGFAQNDDRDGGLVLVIPTITSHPSRGREGWGTGLCVGSGEMLRFFASLRMTIVVLRMTGLDPAKRQTQRPAEPSAAKAVFIGSGAARLKPCP
jgi:hypothetical protein